MKVYRERVGHSTNINETELLDVIKSISVSVGIRRDYALIMSELSVYQSNIKRVGRNTVKCGILTLFRLPSATEVYIDQTPSSLLCVLYNSEGSSCWRLFGVYFTGVPFGFDEYTCIGEV